MATPIVQQPQASTYIHPCEDLLDGGRRREYLDIVVPLYRALLEEDLEAAKVILQDHEHLVRYSINEKKETPLHVAAAGHSTELVKYLVNMMNADELKLKNQDGNTAFCIAAISGNVGMVEIMFEKNEELTKICGSENMMPLNQVAFHGNVTMMYHLYDMSGKMADWENDKKFEVLLKSIQCNIFGLAKIILEDNEQLPAENKQAWDLLQVLAVKPDAFKYESPQSILMESRLQSTSLERDATRATRLLRVLWKRIVEKPKEVIDEILRGPMIEKDQKETYPSQILFIAAKKNNNFFLVELIREYPDLIRKRNDDGQTIFHIAVTHRHDDVYNLLSDIGPMKDLITPIRDKQGNNILHLVGKDTENKAYGDSVTAHSQLFSEYCWFQEVKSMLPPSCRVVENAEGKTPQELFIENHKGLVFDGMKSLIDSINISLMVAVLISTIGFSVVHAIPGGFDQNNGHPMLLRRNYFIGFVVMDVISFISSTTLIISFLSIILSLHHPNMGKIVWSWDFSMSLLRSSVFCITTAFILSLFLLYLKRSWMYIFWVPAYLLFTLFFFTLNIIPELSSLLKLSKQTTKWGPNFANKLSSDPVEAVAMMEDYRYFFI